MKIVSNLHILSFVVSITYPFFTWGGVFSDTLCQNTVVDANIGITTPSVIFKKHLGATNPNQWAMQLSKPLNAERFLASSRWQTIRTDFLNTYGKTNSTRQDLDSYEYDIRKITKVNNISHARSLDIKGNLAESVMDAFYSKDGWEKLDGKRGRNGFDGLYVRRNQKGTIIDWFVADAKSGNAKLRMTNRGMQLSPEWIRGNLEDLLTNAENDYKRMPTEVGRKRISDLKQIMRLPGRPSRVFNAKLEQFGRKTQYYLENIDINGNRIGKPMLINMQEEGEWQRKIYKNLEKNIAIYNPKKAAPLVSKLKENIKNGSIKNDSDFYRFIKREIPDKQTVRSVTQELGSKPSKRPLTSIIKKKNVHSGTGVRIGGSLLVGLEAYYIVSTIYNYNKGRITQTDMIAGVERGVVATAVYVFFEYTKAGEILGTLIQPGAGTIIGIGIGIGLVVTRVYTWYTERQRREFLIAVEHHRANWESKDNETRFNKLIQQLEFDFLQKRESAWQKLIPVN